MRPILPQNQKREISALKIQSSKKTLNKTRREQKMVTQHMSDM